MAEWWWDTGLWIAVALAAALAGYVLVHWALRRLLPIIARRTSGRLQVLDILTEYVRSFSRWVETILGLAITGGAVLAILAEAGVNVEPATSRLAGFGWAAGRWVVNHGLRAVAVIVVGYAINRLAIRILPALLRTALTTGKDGIELEEASKRSNALSQVSIYIVSTLVIMVGGAMVLAELGFSLAPILAGVGVVGIALGFGAQHLVRDLISGLFILVEDQYRVGDVASVGGKTGLVEEVNLRRTVLRDLDGIVHVIPNGEITTASNLTKSFSRVNFDISVAYSEDLDRVIRVLNRVGMELSRDDYFGDLIIEPPQVLRVNSFEDPGLTIKILGVTKPIRQWEVMGELLRRIKLEFDREGIGMAYAGAVARARAQPAPISGREGRRELDTIDAALSPRTDPWVHELEAEASRKAARVDGAEGEKSRVLGNLMAHLAEVRGLLRQPPVALFTDIDGTLVPTSPSPRHAKVTSAVRQALGSLSHQMTVVVLTGRDLAAARSVLGLASVIYQGNHGMESWEQGTSTVVSGAQPLARQVHRLARAARSPLKPVRGLLIEDREFALAFHYGQTPNPTAARERILKFLQGAPEAAGLTVREGKMVVEALLPIEANKGTALRNVVEQRNIKSAVVLGDDLTDVDSFRMLEQLREETGLLGCSVAVLGTGTPPALLAAADFELADPEAVEIFLTWLAAEVHQTQPA